jgi:hypothetical protein
VGKDVETRTVFDAMIRSVKGKANAVGEIWLDGQTVLFCFPKWSDQRLIDWS